MQAEDIERLVRQLVDGELSPTELVRKLTRPLTVDLGDARLDLDRQYRCGHAEVIYAEGKSVPVIEKIVAALLSDGTEALATRVSADQAAALIKCFPAARYNPVARTLRIAPTLGAPTLGATSGSTRRAESTATSAGRVGVRGHVAVISAGTSDLPVAEEAHETADWTGARVTRVTDVGVAGPHRLRERLDEFRAADAIVVVAGMDGALPSVVGGYVPCPVIAVPTSVGYGASFGGLAALLTMLNSCASNVTVVNIDAGFKAGFVAGLIATRAARPVDLQDDRPDLPPQTEQIPSKGPAQ